MQMFPCEFGVCVCVGARVRACVSVCACVRACVRVCVFFLLLLSPSLSLSLSLSVLKSIILNSLLRNNVTQEEAQSGCVRSLERRQANTTQTRIAWHACEIQGTQTPQNIYCRWSLCTSVYSHAE